MWVSPQFPTTYGRKKKYVNCSYIRAESISGKIYGPIAQDHRGYSVPLLVPVVLDRGTLVMSLPCASFCKAEIPTAIGRDWRGEFTTANRRCGKEFQFKVLINLGKL